MTSAGGVGTVSAMRHLPGWLTVLSLAGALSASAAGTNVEAAVRRLQEFQRAQTARPAPGDLVQNWETLAADLLTVLRSEEGRPAPAQVAALAGAPSVSWPALHGVWLILTGGPAAPQDAAWLRALDILPREDGPQPLLSFFAAMEALSPRADGSIRLSGSLREARATVQAAADAARPGLVLPAADAVATSLYEAVHWDGLERVAQWPLSSGSYFRVIARSDLPWPSADRRLAAAFAAAAAAAPDRYEDKWVAHGLLLEQLERMLRREATEDRDALVRFVTPYHLFLGHAVTPASPFRPAAANAASTAFHFARAWDEDAPMQGLFCHAGHLDRVIAVQTLLGKAMLETFDPGRHLFLMPFDAVAAGERWSLRSRRVGYMGYLDAFATRNYPFILRPFVAPRGGTP